MVDKLPGILITAGEPAGIGPDIVIRALQQPVSAAVVVLADPVVMKERAEKSGVTMNIVEISPDHEPPPHRPGQLCIVPISCPRPVAVGVLNPENSSQVIRCIETATDLCLQEKYQAMVTAPVHKAIINEAGYDFSGHTEWIAKQCGCERPVMMLADKRLRVCLATTHLPLSGVPGAITGKLLKQVLQIMDRDIGRLYALEKPRIGVCGLNPHAGEGGYLGREEIEIISPAIDALNDQGLNIVGPLPADTAFTRHQLQSLDAVLAMYHDQGLPVIKHQGFGEVVNVTLGLPIIRTSVDHGTALELAGTGNASASSLISAIDLAVEFVRNQR
jgi:4-hydroxythreonine-4-phosphate dehydrogenase